MPAMTSTHIIAVRHGETAWNVDARLQGHLDIPLNERGHWQARRLALALEGESIDALYSSPLQRARQTAQAIASMTGLRITAEPGLRERGFGQFEGHTPSEIKANWPDAAQRWLVREPDFSPVGGESLRLFQARVLSRVAELAEVHDGQTIVLVGHGGVMDLLYRAAADEALEAPRNWPLGNASINRLVWTGQRLNLVSWSDTAHLDSDVLDEMSS